MATQMLLCCHKKYIMLLLICNAIMLTLKVYYDS